LLLAFLDLIESFIEGALVPGAIADVKRDEREFAGVLEDSGELGFAGLLETPIVEADFVDERFFDFIGGLEVVLHDRVLL
jgi:hypothetical protein